MSKNEFDALLLKKLEEEALEYKPESWQQLSERLGTALPSAIETNPFDALLLEKLQESSFEYNPGSWQQLSQKLDDVVPTETAPTTVTKAFPLRKWSLAIGTAAAVCLAIVLAKTWKTTDNTQRGNNTTALEQPQNPSVTQPATVPTPKETPATKPPFTNNTIANTDHRQPNTGAASNTPGHTNTNQSIKELPAQAPLKPAQTIAVIPTPTKENNHQPKASLAPGVKEKAPEYLTQNNINQPWPESPYEAANGYKGRTPKTNLSFGGGVNYGNLNTGYTAGVTVKRKITRDFFVDGTVAMMYNNNASNVAANNGPSVGGNGNTAARPASFESSISSPALDPMQRLYYVQFNPSVGYQIEDKVALSVGGDFQRILNKKEEIIQPNNADTKVFPNFDVGITTKSEFTITSSIQAGLVYREGLNNLLKSDGGKYVNRRYFQVQFKYNLPLKEK